VKRVAVEAKSGMTVAADAFRTLDAYCALSGGPGVLVYGGDEAYGRKGYAVRPWWAVT
jgi:hypothetical protein